LALFATKKSVNKVLCKAYQETHKTVYCYRQVMTNAVTAATFITSVI